MSPDVQLIPVDKIRVINARSRSKTKYREIVENISKVGLKKPITVNRAAGTDGYDLVSGVYRQTMWNHIVPAEMRGRMAGIEMISFLTGPMLGSSQIGFLAEALGTGSAIWMSAALGIVALGVTAMLLPRFIAYQRSPEPVSPATEAA